MKKILTIVFFQICLHTSYTQNVITFNKTAYFFGDSLYNLHSVNSVSILDSFYIVAIGIVDSSNIAKIGIVKINNKGYDSKKVEFGQSGFENATYPGNTIITDISGNILVTSNIISAIKNDWDGFIIKLDKNLDTIWTLTDALPDTLAGCPPDTNVVNYLTAIKQTPDGGYIAVGNYTMNCTAGNQRAYLLKIDSAGTVEWRKVYQNVTTIFDIEIAPDSGYFFPNYYNNFLQVIKTDKYGNIQWNIVVNNHNMPSYPMDVELLDSNHFIVASAFWYDFANDNRGLTVTKVNTVTQNVVWTKDYYLFNSLRCASLHQNISLSILDNKEIIICGTAYVLKSDSSAYGYKGIMLKLNSNGDSLWAHYYNYGDFPDQCQFNDLVLTEDGGFLAAGFHFPYDGSYNSGAWLVKMDSNGIAPGCFTLNVGDIQETGCAVELYPNPAREVVNVEMASSCQLPASSFEVMDMFGKVVIRESLEIGKSSFSFNVSGLPEGIYILRVMVKDGMIRRKIVVVR